MNGQIWDDTMKKLENMSDDELAEYIINFKPPGLKKVTCDGVSKTSNICPLCSKRTYIFVGRIKQCMNSDTK